MANIIDVAIVVDAPRILKEYGKNNATDTGNYVQLGPRGEGKNYLYMIATWFHVQDEADSELDVFANPGDTIRWRMTSLSMDNTYQCFIKGFVINRGAAYITPPVAKYERITIPQIDTSKSALNTTMPKQIDDVYWETTVLQRGQQVTYHTNFMVTGPGCDAGGGGGGTGDNGNCGGYTYDPFITTSSNN